MAGSRWHTGRIEHAAAEDTAMAFVAYALPVVPGQRERVKRFAEELEPRRAAYEELNRRAGLKRHITWLQEGPMGDLLLTVFETDDPEKLSRAFTDSDYDRWWVSYLKEVHGIDLSVMTPPPPPPISFAWEAPDLVAR